MKNIEIRLMKETEADKVHALARSCFPLLKGLFISKPKVALVALIDGEIIAGTTLKKIKIKDNKYIGYVDFAFVKKEFRRLGIGKELYNKTIKYLEEDCSEVCAMVLDDNKSSWKIFKNEGFNLTPSYSLISKTGLFGAIRLWKDSCLFAAWGHYLWVKNESEHKENSILNMILFLIFNFILMMIVSRSNLFTSLGALSVLFLQLIGGFIGTLFIKDKWFFKIGQGGAPLSLIISMFKGIVPLNGNWYPTNYFSNNIKRKLGIVSCFEWTTLILIMVISLSYKNSITFNSEILKGVLLISRPLLVLKIFATFPFEVFGGERVLKFNRPLYIVFSAVSSALIFANILY